MISLYKMRSAKPPPLLWPDNIVTNNTGRMVDGRYMQPPSIPDTVILLTPARTWLGANEECMVITPITAEYRVCE